MTISDAAAEGLFGGLGAGITAALVIMALGLIGGEGPAIILGRFDPNARADALRGVVMLVGAGSVYGALFGIGYHFTILGRLPAWLAGLLFGALVLAVAYLYTLPGQESPLLAIPFLSLAAAHAVYGLALGFLITRVDAG
jgi:hypothetical protein